VNRAFDLPDVNAARVGRHPNTGFDVDNFNLPRIRLAVDRSYNAFHPDIRRIGKRPNLGFAGDHNLQHQSETAEQPLIRQITDANRISVLLDRRLRLQSPDSIFHAAPTK